MPMTTLTIQEVNNIISEHFIKIFGNVVEHYPAAAIGILKNRPFQNSNDISVAINNFLDKLEMKGKFIKLFYKNCIDKYMFTESILHYVLKKSTLEGLITVSCVIIANILKNVTFNTIYKAKSLALSKCLSFQRPQLYLRYFFFLNQVYPLHLKCIKWQKHQ
jgi:hypothetical protein